MGGRGSSSLGGAAAGGQTAAVEAGETQQKIVEPGNNTPATIEMERVASEGKKEISIDRTNHGSYLRATESTSARRGYYGTDAKVYRVKEGKAGNVTFEDVEGERRDDIGKRGGLAFKTEKEGVYAYQDFSSGSNREAAGFFIVKGGTVREVRREDAINAFKSGKTMKSESYNEMMRQTAKRAGYKWNPSEKQWENKGGEE